MEKIIKNYKMNLTIILVCYVIAILFNTHLFTSGDIFKILYGITMIILGVVSLFSLILINKDINKSAQISMIIGPIMSILSLIEGFIYGEGFIVNFRLSILIIMIGGILIFNGARKIKNNY